jgi:ribonuclease HI
MKSVVIYVDGACSGNPGPGGWAALLFYGQHEKVITGGAAHTTNNRMELTAAIKALDSLQQSCQVALFTDSQYVQLGISKWLIQWQKRNWRNSANQLIKNRDLWQMLVATAQRHVLSWHWVRGHNGHPENERVDCLAKRAMIEFR